MHAFFLICLSCSFQNLSIWPKTEPFFPILHVFAPLQDLRAYSAWSWKTTQIMWIFGQAWYPPLTFECPHPPGSTPNLPKESERKKQEAEIFLLFEVLAHCLWLHADSYRNKNISSIFYISKSTSISTQHSSLWNTLGMMLVTKDLKKWKILAELDKKFGIGLLTLIVLYGIRHIKIIQILVLSVA